MALHRFTALLPAALLLCAGAAQAANEVRSQYSSDRAACASVPAESRAACVREAGAAAQAARTGQLSSSDTSIYERNALARCEAFKTPQARPDCAARVRSCASVSGSVVVGGVLRVATTHV